MAKPSSATRGQLTPRLLTAGLLSVSAAFAIVLWFARSTNMRAQSLRSTAWRVKIVLPSRVVAGGPATLAVLGADGRLASDVTVEVGNDRVMTDGTGRAFLDCSFCRGRSFCQGVGVLRGRAD